MKFRQFFKVIFYFVSIIKFDISAHKLIVLTMPDYETTDCLRLTNRIITTNESGTMILSTYNVNLESIAGTVIGHTVRVYI